MNVLVIGGTRGVGRAVVMATHAAGHTLTVMARNAADFASPVSGIRMVVGDAADPDDIERATAGQRAVVWAVGVAATRREVNVFSRGTHHLLLAMQAHGVRRLVCVTGGATGPHAGRGAALRARIARPLARRAVGDDQKRQETQIRASAVDWTIVRPAAMTDAGATGLYQVRAAPVAGRAKPLPRADVADFIVANLAAPDYFGSVVVLTG